MQRKHEKNKNKRKDTINIRKIDYFVYFCTIKNHNNKTNHHETTSKLDFYEN